MKFSEEFSRRKEIIKSLSGKEKVRYIWTYYKWYIIITLGLIIAAGNLLYHTLVDPDVALNGIILNAYGVDSEEPLGAFVEDYMTVQEMDAKEEIVTFDISFLYEPNDETGMKNYSVIQGLGAWIKNETVDVVTADRESMEELTNATYFVSLTEILTTKQLSAYSSKIISVNGVPLLLDVSKSEELSKVYLDQYDEIALGVAKGAPNVDEIRAFIDYLMEN